MEKHIDSATCKRLSVRRQNEALQDQQATADNVKFYIKGKEIERVKEFEYLGRIISDNDDDTKCIDNAIKKARR